MKMLTSSPGKWHDQGDEDLRANAVLMIDDTIEWRRFVVGAKCTLTTRTAKKKKKKNLRQLEINFCVQFDFYVPSVPRTMPCCDWWSDDAIGQQVQRFRRVNCCRIRLLVWCVECWQQLCCRAQARRRQSSSLWSHQEVCWHCGYTTLRINTERAFVFLSETNKPVKQIYL